MEYSALIFDALTRIQCDLHVHIVHVVHTKDTLGPGILSFIYSRGCPLFGGPKFHLSRYEVLDLGQLNLSFILEGFFYCVRVH